MLALDADFHLKGTNGWRVVKAGDFFQGMLTVDLAPDEILAKVTFAPVRTAAYAKLHQRASRFAIVGVAAALAVSDGTLSSARIGLTGASSSPSRLENVEAALTGRAANSGTFSAAAQVAGDGIEDLNDDIHAGADYRRAMVRVFTRRALDGALARIAS